MLMFPPPSSRRKSRYRATKFRGSPRKHASVESGQGSSSMRGPIAVPSFGFKK